MSVAPPDFYARPGITNGELRRVIWLIPNGNKAATWLQDRAQGVVGVAGGLAVSCEKLTEAAHADAFSHAERAARDIVSAGLRLVWDKLPLEIEANAPGFYYRSVGRTVQSFTRAPLRKGRK